LQWVENPYWQHFCGNEYFEHEFPLDPSSMTRWRQRVSEAGMEKLNVDTTVQEKAISFPADVKLSHRMREKLVELSKECGVELRQSYTRKSKYSLLMRSRYKLCRQMRRSKRELKNVKKYLGRVVRDIERKIEGNEEQGRVFSEPLTLARHLLSQKRQDKNKVYSLHAPEVECIFKGKAHHGNPYDGHTLEEAVVQAERVSGLKARDIYVDRGYRGHTYTGEAKVPVAGRGMKKLKASVRKWLRRRSAIEAVIGHAKIEGRLGRNYLLGKEGDKINAILAGCGYNMRKLLRVLLFCLYFLRQRSLSTS